MAHKKPGPMTKKVGNHLIVDAPRAIVAYKIREDGTKQMLRCFCTWDAAVSWVNSFKR